MPETVKCKRCGETHPMVRDELACITQNLMSREESDVVWDRVADRLGGHTHDEVVERHPKPQGSNLPGPDPEEGL